MDFTLNNLEWLICHKTNQPSGQPVLKVWILALLYKLTSSVFFFFLFFSAEKIYLSAAIYSTQIMVC